MDKLYIGDIPLTYKYANFSNDYIDLYNTDTLIANNTYTRYRIYLYDNLFLYNVSQVRAGATQTIANTIEVTDNIIYRRDFPSILTMTLIIAVFGIWLFNILSSAIRKGGGLGGLL